MILMRNAGALHGIWYIPIACFIISDEKKIVHRGKQAEKSKNDCKAKMRALK
jgi:hypothetical protein